MRVRAFSQRALVVAALAIASALPGSAASNVVPGTHLDNDKSQINANDLKPSACSAITVNGVRTGSGTITGNGTSELIAASGGIDIIDGRGGDDCILGGGGNDTISGGTGTDVCIGGPGTDVFTIDCETQIQ